MSVDIAERFVDQGVIVSTRGRAPGQTQVYRARPDKPYGNLAPGHPHRPRQRERQRDPRRGPPGTRPGRGDRRPELWQGSVQSIFELRSAPAGLKLTTAKFYSPKNRAYSEQGVTPDIQAVLRAKPAADAEPELEPQEFGDPSTDKVLEMALQQARRQLTANR